MKFAEQVEDAPTSPLGYEDTFTDICVIQKDECAGAGVKSFTTSQV